MLKNFYPAPILTNYPERRTRIHILEKFQTEFCGNNTDRIVSLNMCEFPLSTGRYELPKSTLNLMFADILSCLHCMIPRLFGVSVMDLVVLAQEAGDIYLCYSIEQAIAHEYYINSARRSKVCSIRITHFCKFNIIDIIQFRNSRMVVKQQQQVKYLVIKRSEVLLLQILMLHYYLLFKKISL